MIKDFHDTSWCMALKRLHEDMNEENEFMNEVSKYHVLSEDDLIDMEKQLTKEQSQCHNLKS